MAKRREVIPLLQQIAARQGVTVPWDRITINRFKSDTCGCILEQWFDDAAEPRVVLYVRTTESCAAHPIPGEDQWDTVNGENRRKNTILSIVEANVPVQVIDESGRTVLRSARERTSWWFSDDHLMSSDERVLEIEIADATPQQRQFVAAAAGIQFGADALRVS